MSRSDVRFTRHAWEQMVERDIRPEWVLDALSAPDREHVDPVYAERTHALRAIEPLKGRWLHVVYVEDSDHLRVITAFVDRRARRDE